MLHIQPFPCLLIIHLAPCMSHISRDLSHIPSCFVFMKSRSRYGIPFRISRSISTVTIHQCSRCSEMDTEPFMILKQKILHKVLARRCRSGGCIIHGTTCQFPADSLPHLLKRAVCPASAQCRQCFFKFRRILPAFLIRRPGICHVPGIIRIDTPQIFCNVYCTFRSPVHSYFRHFSRGRFKTGNTSQINCIALRMIRRTVEYAPCCDILLCRLLCSYIILPELVLNVFILLHPLQSLVICQTRIFFFRCFFRPVFPCHSCHQILYSSDYFRCNRSSHPEIEAVLRFPSHIQTFSCLKGQNSQH